MADQDGGESCEELLNLLHQRLVSTGEWTALLVQLRQMLEESSWDVQLREYAERRYIAGLWAGEAREQQQLNLATMVDKLGAYAHGTD